MNATKHAITDALGSPISNGPTHKRPKTKQPKPKQGFTPVIIARKPFGNWGCDACGHPGHGLKALQAHNERTGHDKYTDTDWLGITK